MHNFTSTLYLQTSEEYSQSLRCAAEKNYTDSNVNETYFDATMYKSAYLPEEVDWRSQGIVTDVKDEVQHIVTTFWN